jgi:hypothetical protein
MNAEKHVRERQRLNQALNGNLDKTCESIKKCLVENCIDASPGIAFDTFCYVLEEFHLERLNLPSRP